MVYSPGTLSTSDYELMSLKINKPNFKPFLVTVVYKPPKGNSTKCVKFISNIMSNNPNSEFWILGDFNIDFLKRNITSTKKILNSTRAICLVHLIKTVTRPSGNKGTCIDWILTNSEYVSMSYVSNNLISDHYPVICVRKKSREYREQVPKFIKLYNRLDLKVLGNILDNLDWSDFDNSNDPNFKWSFIKQSVGNVIEVMCPLKKIFVTKNNHLGLQMISSD